MLASDAVEDKIVFPCIAQPKIDGVRGLNMLGPLTGRSLKTHANIHTTNFFSMGAFRGFDGEMAAEHECHPELCRLTTSALSRIEGEPWIMWHLFDYVTDETKDLPYIDRMSHLFERLKFLQKVHPVLSAHLKMVESHVCQNMEQLLTLDNKWLDMGYEGTIVRRPDGMHKQGRSTVREGGLLRIKRFIEEEAVVEQIIEGEANGNEATINELGQTERSTHQANMTPNGMVGAMMCKLLKDVVWKDKVLFTAGQVIKVGAGRMPHDDRSRYFQNPSLLTGQIIKFKMFPIGCYNKPRFPTFQSIRMASDV
jgi:DNA ligase-1